MLLVIDVGNTHMVVGIYEGDKLKRSWRISTDLKKTEDEFAMLFKNLLAEKELKYADIRAVVISCVVPPLTWILVKMSEDYLNIRPLIVNCHLKLNIKIKVDYPEEVGADRIVNAVAVYALYGGPAIIIDFGTATTFCALDKNGNYLGGAIAPGLELSSYALFEKTAKLPEVELVEPKYAIGRNTIQAIQSGVYLGHLGLTRELIERFKKELTGDPMVIATGGLGELIEKGCKLIDKVDPLLTLKGLRMIYHLNT
jgi:type III pantothenate kinase